MSTDRLTPLDVAMLRRVADHDVTYAVYGTRCRVWDGEDTYEPCTVRINRLRLRGLVTQERTYADRGVIVLTTHGREQLEAALTERAS